MSNVYLGLYNQGDCEELWGHRQKARNIQETSEGWFDLYPITNQLRC